MPLRGSTPKASGAASARRFGWLHRHRRADAAPLAGAAPLAIKLARRCRPGSLPFLALLLAGAAAFAFAWAALPGRGNDLEHQGIDVVNHAILVYRQAHPVPGSEQEYHATYPQAAHALAAWLMPLLGDNAIRAMDCVAWMSLLAMLACQYTLLCRLMSAWPALGVLLAWHWLCWQTLFANRNLLTTNYFYPQAVGMVVFWLALVLLSTRAASAPWRVVWEGLALLAAVLAYACHIVPGVAAFATLAAVQAYQLFAPGRLEALLRLALTAVVGIYVVPGSDQFQLMASARFYGNYWLPYNRLWLLLLWVPALFVACSVLLRALWRRQPLRPDNIAVVLTLALLAAGVLQGYLALEAARSVTGGYYSAKKFFFLTFPLGGLLFFGAAAWWLSRRRLVVPARWQRTLRTSLAAGCALAALIGLGRWMADDPRRPGAAAAEFDPIAGARLLATLRSQVPPRTYFHDPAAPMNSLFAAVVGLQMNFDAGEHTWECLYLKNFPLWLLGRHGCVGHLLLPPEVDGRPMLGSAARVAQTTGPLLRYAVPHGPP
jgi:hypothetical protein